MAKQVIGIGAAPNDGNGDPLRTAFDKANDNFTELYDQVPTPDEKAALAGTSGTPSDSNRFVTAEDKTAVVADIPARDALAWGAPETGRLVFVVDAYIDTPATGQGDPEVTVPVVGRTYIWTGTAFVPVEPSETGWKKSGITTLSGSPTIKGEVNIHGPGDEPVYAINSSGRFYWEAMHPELVSAADHGLSLLNWLTVDGSGAIVKGSDLAQTLLGVVSTVESTSVYSYVTPGGRVTGLSGLTPGSTYYAQTNGTTSTTPSSKPVFKAVSATAAILFAYVVDVPDATSSVKGLAKLFDTYTPAAARADGSVSEAALLSAMRGQKARHNKTAHGFAVGDCITTNSSGELVIFTYDITTQHKPLVGIVSDIIDANNFLYVTPGNIIDTLAALTPGTLYFIDHTNGHLTATTAVANSVARYEALVALTATTGIILHNEHHGRRNTRTEIANFTIDESYAGTLLRITTNGTDITATLDVDVPGFYVRGFVQGTHGLKFTGAVTTWYGTPALITTIPPGSFFTAVVQNFTGGNVEWNVYIELPAYVQDSLGSSIRFDRPRMYGTIVIPITGNITLDSGGLIPGTVQLIIHNDSGEPNYPTEFKKAAGSLSYVPNVNNFIYAHCVESATIIYTITQIP